MDMGSIADWISAIATLAAVVLAYFAVRIAERTVERSKLDYIAERCDRVSDSLGNLLTAAAAHKASLQPYWENEPPLGSPEEVAAHRATHEFEACKAVLLNSIRSLHSAIPQAWVDQDIEQLTAWVDGAYRACYIPYLALVGDWGKATATTPLRELVRFRQLVRAELTPGGSDQVLAAGLEWAGWDSGDDFSSANAAFSVYERVLAYAVNAVSNFVVRGHRLAAVSATLKNVPAEAIDWPELPQPITPSSAGSEAHARRLRRDERSAPEQWELLRPGQPTLVADHREQLLDSINPRYQKARRLSHEDGERVLGEWTANILHRIQADRLATAVEKDRYEPTPSALAAIVAEKCRPFDGYYSNGQWTRHWDEIVPLLLVDDHYTPASNRPKPTGNVEFHPSADPDWVLRRNGTLRHPRPLNGLGRGRVASGETPTPAAESVPDSPSQDL